MNRKTDNSNKPRDSFWAIRSFGLAFVVRGFELLLLTAILSVFYFYFPAWNLLAVLAIALPVVVLTSYFLYKIINRGKNKNMSGFSLPQRDSNEPNKSNEQYKSFWQWLLKQYFLLFSQVAVALSGIGFIATFIYYIKHGDYYEYLEPRKIQDGLFWLHIIVLILFIIWFIWIRDEEILDEKAKKTFKAVLKREIKESKKESEKTKRDDEIDENDEAGNCKRQLKRFKNWFLLFWISMLLLYVAFIAQRNSPNYAPFSKEEVFRMFNDFSSKKSISNDENTEKHQTENSEANKILEERVKKIEKAIELTPDKEINYDENQIYLQIETLKVKRLKYKLSEIKDQAEKLGANEKLKDKKDSVYDEIYPQINETLSNLNNENQRQLIEGVEKKVAALLERNDLLPEERELLVKIKNIENYKLNNLDELNGDVKKIAGLIHEAEQKNLLSKSEEITKNIEIAADPGKSEEERDGAIIKARELNNKNYSYAKSLNRILFACITYVFNNFGWWVILVCFILTTTLTSDNKSLKREKRYIIFSFVGFLLLSISLPVVMYVIFNRGTAESNITSWIVFFDGFSGIINAVALALLVARLDSKLIGLPSYLVGILYFYAAFQPLFVVFEQPGEISQLIKTVVLVAVFISKIYFFLIITYAIQTGRVLAYLYCYPTLSNRVNTIFANPFRIEGIEITDGFNLKIFRKNDEVFFEKYAEKYLRENKTSITELIDELKQSAQAEDENEEVFIKKNETTEDKYQIKIFGKNKNLICESKNESMTKTKADKLRIELIKYIPFCEPSITNESKQISDSDKDEKAKDGET